MFVSLFYYFLVFFVWEKKKPKTSWGGIGTFSNENMTKWDLGLGKKCQTVVRIQMFWGEWQEGYSEGSKE